MPFAWPKELTLIYLLALSHLFASLIKKLGFSKIIDSVDSFASVVMLEIVMNELRRFKHSADFSANSYHNIESAAISASKVSTPLTHLH